MIKQGQYFKHADNRITIVVAIGDESFTYCSYTNANDYITCQPPLTTVEVPTTDTDYEDVNNDLDDILGVTWVRFKDGVQYIGDKARPRQPPLVVPRWAFRAACSAAQLSAITTAINSFGPVKKNNFTEFWAGAATIRKSSRFLDEMLAASVFPDRAAINTVLRSAINIASKNLQ